MHPSRSDNHRRLGILAWLTHDAPQGIGKGARE